MKEKVQFVHTIGVRLKNFRILGVERKVITRDGARERERVNKSERQITKEEKVEKETG